MMRRENMNRVITMMKKDQEREMKVSSQLRYRKPIE
jgi:hypothetical protein